MRAYVGVTDGEWFDLLAQQETLDEVNFWQPSGSSQFKALSAGELFLFKLHSPNNFIVGGGFFAHFSLLPVSLAWEAFGIANGAGTLQEMRARIAKYRRTAASRFEDYRIGCILLTQPFFLDREDWIPIQADWSPSIVRGKGYDLATPIGRQLWERVQAALAHRAGTRTVAEPSVVERYGDPVLMRPRLGQGSFRVLVTDAYNRQCAVTEAKVLPVLEAAHIKPHSAGGEHSPENGLLLRRDLHALFDVGYLTVTPERRVEISRYVKEDWDNGEDYYKLHGTRIRPPARTYPSPSDELLRWHNDIIFRG